MGQVAKRLLDLGASLVGLVLLFPVMIVLGVIVALYLGRPVIFKQIRPGLNGRPFTMYKFRTMTNERGDDGQFLPDAQRLTSFGQFLRSTSLDELPELINVLMGDMSLVGPRPLLMEYLERYTPEQARRHEVKPGITGWAQINGRNALSWDQRFQLDVWYVDNRSFWFDVQIILRTVLKVMVRDGIAAEGHATMPTFQRSGRE